MRRRGGEAGVDLADLSRERLDELTHVGAGLLGALCQELIRVGHDGRRVFEPVVNGVDDALAVGGQREEIRDPSKALKNGVGIAQEPGRQDEGPLLRARVRQAQDGIGGGQALDLNDVDVDGARPPALVALAAQLAFDAARLGEKLVGSGDGGADDDGIPVVGLGHLPGGEDRLGAHDRRHVVDLEALHVGQGLDRVHERDGHIPEVSADRQDDLARTQVLGHGGLPRARCRRAGAPRGGGFALSLLGRAGCLGAAVGLDLSGQDGAVLGLVDSLEGQRQRQRVGRTGAHGDGHVGEGLVDRRVRLVDGDLGADDAVVAHDARGDVLGQGLDEVDGASGEHGHRLVGDVGVGDRRRDVVVGTRGFDPHDDVGTKALALRALEVVHTVVGQRPQSFQGDDDASATQRRSPFGRWPPRCLLRRGPARPTHPGGRSRRQWKRCRCRRRLRGP